MTNDLKNFLEKNSEIETFDGAVNVSEHNNKVVNFVLELVEKEVEKIEKECWAIEHYEESLKKLSTIINNLRV